MEKSDQSGFRRATWAWVRSWRSPCDDRPGRCDSADIGYVWSTRQETSRSSLSPFARQTKTCARTSLEAKKCVNCIHRWSNPLLKKAYLRFAFEWSKPLKETLWQMTTISLNSCANLCVFSLEVDDSWLRIWKRWKHCNQRLPLLQQNVEKILTDSHSPIRSQLLPTRQPRPRPTHHRRWRRAEDVSPSTSKKQWIKRKKTQHWHAIETVFAFNCC